jgi:hypothetical protein
LHDLNIIRLKSQDPQGLPHWTIGKDKKKKNTKQRKTKNTKTKKQKYMTKNAKPKTKKDRANHYCSAHDDSAMLAKSQVEYYLGLSN